MSGMSHSRFAVPFSFEAAGRLQTYWCVLKCTAVCCNVLQCVTVCCSVLQCLALCCSVLQCTSDVKLPGACKHIGVC